MAGKHQQFNNKRNEFIAIDFFCDQLFPIVIK